MTLEHQYANHRLPAWTRVAVFALDHDGEHLDRGQLRRAIDPHGLIRATDVWRAVRHCIRRGILADTSTTTELHLARPDQEDAA